MNNWKVIFATMLIFGTGVVTGGLLVHHSERMRPVHPQHAQAPKAPAQSFAGGLRLDFLRRAERELDLTTGQRERIDLILKESQERTRLLMEPIAPRIREELQRTKDEFRAALLPEQQAKFDELLKRQPRPRDLRRPPGSSPGRPTDSTLPQPPAAEAPAPQPAPH